MDYPPEATFYIRLSFMNPRPSKEKLVSALMDNLLEFFSTQPGFVHGYSLVSGDPRGRVGRVTMWKSGEDADRAANSQHVLAVRSEIMQLIEEDSHVERSYTAFDPLLAKASR